MNDDILKAFDEYWDRHRAMYENSLILRGDLLHAFESGAKLKEKQGVTDDDYSRGYNLLLIESGKNGWPSLADFAKAVDAALHSDEDKKQ